MPPHNLTAVQTLMEAAFGAVGFRMPIEGDEIALYVRDLTIEENGGDFLCFEATNPETPLFSMPRDVPEAMAAAAVLHILKGVVARAVSAD